jgi:hydroxyacylglutathione hydrolase
VEEAHTYKLLTDTTPRMQFQEFDLSDVQRQGTVVDVRTTAEHHSSHIPGAISVPYTRLKAQMERIPHSSRLFVHCASGYRAALASSFLRAQGFDVVHVDGAYSSFQSPSQHG